MSYIVINADSSGHSTFEEFADINTAVEHLENACNGPGSAGSRLFRLDPVEFEVKQYFKIEIPAAPTQPDPAVSVFDSGGTSDPVPDPSPPEATESSESEPVIHEAQLSGESRRGLFGR